MAKAQRTDTQPPSFFGMREKSEPGKYPRHFWRVKPTGDYGADCEIGTRLGLEYLAYQNSHEASCLQHIVEDMPRDLTGVEIGFLTIVAHAAVAGENRAEEIAAYWDRCDTERKGALGTSHKKLKGGRSVSR
jgi:hypothetical protein